MEARYLLDDCERACEGQQLETAWRKKFNTPAAETLQDMEILLTEFNWSEHVSSQRVAGAQVEVSSKEKAGRRIRCTETWLKQKQRKQKKEPTGSEENCTKLLDSN